MNRIVLILALFAIFTLPLCGGTANFDKKPAPDAIFAELKKGNERFAGDKSIHPHASNGRRILAAEKSQGDFAVATVLGCSDSRVPLELVFDAGIMDLFVVRVPGNVCQGDEIGGVEYGIHHAYTPAVVILGHSDCGAVTAVVKGGHKLERNIPKLLNPIREVVEKERKANPGISDKELIALAIRENVYHEIALLFEQSAATRNIVKTGKVKVTGGIYDLPSGKVEWLDSARIDKILKDADTKETRETKEFAD